MLMPQVMSEVADSRVTLEMRLSSMEGKARGVEGMDGHGWQCEGREGHRGCGQAG